MRQTLVSVELKNFGSKKFYYETFKISDFLEQSAERELTLSVYDWQVGFFNSLRKKLNQRKSGYSNC